MPEEQRVADGIVNPLPSAPIPPVPIVVGFRQTDDISQLATALAAATLKFGPVKRTTHNTYLDTYYADLATIIDATRSPLAEQGLVIMQSPQVSGVNKTVKITTRLLHASGQFIEEELILPATNPKGDFSTQSIGASITYARRYAQQSILNISAEADDDGNSTSEPEPPPAPKAPPVPKKKPEPPVSSEPIKSRNASVPPPKPEKPADKPYNPYPLEPETPEAPVEDVKDTDIPIPAKRTEFAKRVQALLPAQADQKRLREVVEKRTNTNDVNKWTNGDWRKIIKDVEDAIDFDGGTGPDKTGTELDRLLGKIK
jgi:outer membrane biosynthesis protein TonB